MAVYSDEQCYVRALKMSYGEYKKRRSAFKFHIALRPYLIKRIAV